MLNNLLISENLFTGLFWFVVGMLIIFLGMAIIILVVSVIGKIMNKDKKKANEDIVETEEVEEVQPVAQEEIPAHVKAAIVAAITAYYFNQQSECEFKIKKIKRI